MWAQRRSRRARSFNCFVRRRNSRPEGECAGAALVRDMGRDLFAIAVKGQDGAAAGGRGFAAGLYRAAAGGGRENRLRAASRFASAARKAGACERSAQKGTVRVAVALTQSSPGASRCWYMSWTPQFGFQAASAWAIPASAVDTPARATRTA